ncbi:MAG: DNA polymerase I [Ruminococcaceae bacterium]|nr:DNA polymerase I [Oscillospiraceae bacterium]
MIKKLLAIDGNSILNRAFYGVRPLTTKDGFHTNALYGLVNMISKQAELLKPDYCAVAFDLKTPTFRHRMYDAYKAGRRPMPEELAMQMPVAKELLRAMGYTVLEKEEYEADDILGTLAQLCRGRSCDAYIMTGDRDALQLIGENTHVLLATNAETIDVNEAAFFEKYGVKSSQFVDVKALMGDSSDNIPGVPGIGEKTALKLIAEYGSLDGVYEQLPTAKHTPSVRSKLESGKDSAYLSRDLARIFCEVPLGLELDDLQTNGGDSESVKRLFTRLEFSVFLKRFHLDGISSSEAEAISRKTVTQNELSQLLSEHSLIAFDVSDGTVRFSDGTEVWEIEQPLFELYGLLKGKTLICYDVKRFYKQFLDSAFEELSLFDIMLGAYLVNSAKSNYELSTLLSDYLGVTSVDERLLTAYVYRLYQPILEKMEESGQKELFDRLEMPLAKVLADMERVGFRIDREGIAAYGEKLSAVAEILESQIYFHAGKEFNINSPKQLGEVLFDTLGLPHAKKTKTGYSTNAEILEKLRSVHPIIEDVLDYRQVTKLKSTYADGLLKVADENGRVHTTFKQTGTATGRLSSTEPNLQNIPVRTELGRELRKFFLPENADYVIVDADYSQIELRLLAHVSGDSNMIHAFLEGVDIHTSTAATVFGVAPSEVTLEMRKRAKAVNFGIMYGIGAFSLSDDIGVSRAEAQAFIDRYLESYPGIDAYLKDVIKLGYEQGYVSTLFGRRRYIPELMGTNKMQQKFGERVAMNSPIQGTAADVIKLAMVRAHSMLKESGIDARLILQVHDELLIEAHRDCAAAAEEILKRAMEEAVAYTVPLCVEIQTGETWFDAK